MPLERETQKWDFAMPERTDWDNQPSNATKLLALLPVKQREETASILAKQDAQSLQLLTNIISSEHTNRRTRAILLLVPGILMVIATIASLSDASGNTVFSAAGGLLLLALSARTSIPTALEKAAVETVVLSRGKRSLGALLETLHISNLPPALRKQSKQMLTDLLQSLTPDDAGLLTAAHRVQLSRILNYLQRDSEVELRLATLAALQHVGDQYCLGVISMLAEGEAAPPNAQRVREAARSCLEQIGVRLDCGPVTQIPEYTNSLIHQIQSDGWDYQIVATCVLALRRLLPQLQAANFRAVLSERQRDRLYLLLTLPLMMNQDRYSINMVQEEILRTAHRLADTRALAAVRKIANVQAPNPAARQLRATAQETLLLLEAQLERERENKTLLRGASAPVAPVEELLRAAAPIESRTGTNELLRASVLPGERAPFTMELPFEESANVLLSHKEDPLS